RVYAQSDGTSMKAKQLLKQGLALADAKRWEDACPMFEASLRYERTPKVLFNLAICYDRIVKLASAWQHFREFALLADWTSDAKRIAEARERMAEPEPWLAKLTITRPVIAPAGLILTRNGLRIDGVVGIAFYIDAGSHEIIASAPGFEPFTETVTLVDGQD